MNDLLDHLRHSGLLSKGEARLEPMTGGVSSEIYLVEQGANRFVVKRALPKLKVQDDWRADTARNAVEWECLRYLNEIQPDCVPRLLHHDKDHDWFAMEFLGGELFNWKGKLLQGETVPSDAERAGHLMGSIHRASWGNPDLARLFDTTENFKSLRTDPYLRTAGLRNPAVGDHLETEANRLENTHLALVHGDFSPKNILLNPDRLILLDAEVAWFGDPVFDVAFLLNHLFLKSRLRHGLSGDFHELILTFWDAYQTSLSSHFNEALETRMTRLLAMLMLARVDGKSPVEYLVDNGMKMDIRNFASKCILLQRMNWNEFLEAWRKAFRQM